MLNIKERLSVLRQKMSMDNIDFYLVPSTDAHNNEYLPKCWLRRPWISGFTGSAGEVLVAKDHAYLWTDGRYYLQADKELDKNLYTLMPQSGFVPETETWLQENAKGKIIGVDSHLISIARARRLNMVMSAINGKLVLLDNNLVDECKLALGESLEMPFSKALYLDEKYTGEGILDKLSWLRGCLNKENANFIALNVLDEINWLFNLRGSDIEFNPLIICYAIIGVDTANLYVDKNKINEEIVTQFKQNNIIVKAYEDFAYDMNNLNGKVWLDETKANYWMYKNINKNNPVIFLPSPIVYKKACKNTIEINGTQTAHKKDAVVLAHFFYWLNNNWQAGIDEITCAQKLYECRSSALNFMGLSFNTISGFASNSAIIHYGVTNDTKKVVNDSNMYLLDSGSQYFEGTTDVTRTVHLGTATPEQKRHYTLVLKGHLAVGRAVFTHGTCGEHLDILARNALWGDYLNYRHGTGHGVGSALCVHEGPQKISQAPTNIPLVPGMIVSNEPGVYIKDQYGIRIENLCLVKEVTDERAKNSEYGPFYQFETLTLFPYAKGLIDVELLTTDEREQISAYYAQIKTEIYPLLEKPVLEWMEEEMNLFIL